MNQKNRDHRTKQAKALVKTYELILAENGREAADVFARFRLRSLGFDVTEQTSPIKFIRSLKA